MIRKSWYWRIWRKGRTAYSKETDDNLIQLNVLVRYSCLSFFFWICFLKHEIFIFSLISRGKYFLKVFSRGFLTKNINFEKVRPLCMVQPMELPFLTFRIDKYPKFSSLWKITNMWKLSVFVLFIKIIFINFSVIFFSVKNTTAFYHVRYFKEISP